MSIENQERKLLNFLNNQKTLSKKDRKKKNVYLTASELARKYELELMFNSKINNRFKFKLDSANKEIPLSYSDKSYRKGFLRAYKSKNK